MPALDWGNGLMRVELTIKNYRCFHESKPARLVLQKGFTGFLGINNSGKSALLRFFYELRGLFRTFTSGQGVQLAHALRGVEQTFELQPSVTGAGEMFSKLNNHDIEIRLRVAGGDEDAVGSTRRPPSELVFTIPRASNTWRVALFSGRDLMVVESASLTETGLVVVNNSPVADISPFLDACRLLADTLYLGAFRNAINVGTKQSYFDIDIGQAFISRWRDLKSGDDRRLNEEAYKLT